jgi:NADPH-dependent 2,4-dienoyl-CoA reductase/sulfur reductase-like enzyme
VDRLEADLLIVGAGPAGMSAAVAASKRDDVRVAVVDDNPHVGGQIWRAELGRLRSARAIELVRLLDNEKIRIIKSAAVYAYDGTAILAETPSGKTRIGYQKLIIATGARERFLPFPGWTLPNVYGAAGLQALVKGGANVQGRRVVVAGTGPLLLVVAEYLETKGAEVIAICEQTSNRKLDRFALGLLRTPSKIFQGIALRGKLRGIPYWKNSWVSAAHGGSNLRSVTVQRFGTAEEIECDMLACGFHLVPNIELAQLLGCSIAGDRVWVNEYQQTSIGDVYCAGEPTGIGGVEASVVEGKIAGFAATGQLDKARSLFRVRRRTNAFARKLDQTFMLRDELRTLPASSTVVCRCEDVQYGKLAEYDEFRMAKLQTRCGMGSCQGRVCGAAVEFLFGWKDRSIRPPIYPVKMENL